MWTVIKAFFTANIGWIKAAGAGVLIAAIFLGGVHYEKLIWDSTVKKDYEKQIKDLEDEIIKQNNINAETRSKLDTAKKSSASLTAQLKVAHEKPHTNCTASPDSMSVIRAAIKATNN